jgi:hypothetical protein
MPNKFWESLVGLFRLAQSTRTLALPWLLQAGITNPVEGSQKHRLIDQSLVNEGPKFTPDRVGRRWQ